MEQLPCSQEQTHQVNRVLFLGRSPVGDSVSVGALEIVPPCHDAERIAGNFLRVIRHGHHSLQVEHTLESTQMRVEIAVGGSRQKRDSLQDKIIFGLLEGTLKTVLRHPHGPVRPATQQ